MIDLLPKFSALFGRLLLGSVFLVAGLNKLTGFTGSQDYLETIGVPGFILAPVIVLEIVGAVMIISGWKIHWAALVLGLFTLATAFVLHFDLGNQLQQFMFMKKIGIAGALLYIYSKESPREG